MTPAEEKRVRELTEEIAELKAYEFKKRGNDEQGHFR